MKFIREIILVLFLVLIANSGFSASTGTLVLTGTVPLINNIVVTPSANASALNIVSGEVGRLIATVSEESNDINGYLIQVYSVNTSRLMNGTIAVPYQISYDGGTYVTVPASTLPLTVKTVGALTARTMDTSNVNINITAAPNAIAGTYTDTITLSIVAR